ncbi:MAG: GerMN domain-containing protein [Bacillota bacterium]
MRKLALLGIIAGTLLLGGCFSDATTTNGTPAVKPATEQVVLYYANKDATKVVVEKRDVAPDKKTMQNAVTQLIAGPSDNRTHSFFPKGTKCLGVVSKNGVATVDFNDALKSVKTELGSGEQMLLIASLVNTLTEFQGVTSIQISVNGKLLKVLGDFDLSEPIGRSDELIEK